MTESTATLPPRWQAAHRAWLTLLVAVIAIALLYIAWYTYARSLNFAYLFPDRASPKNLPADANAATVYAMIFADVPELERSPGHIPMPTDDAPPFYQLWWDITARLKDRLAPKLALLQTATDMPDVDWTPMATLPIKQRVLNPTTFCQHLNLLATRAALLGNDAEALQLLQQSTTLAGRIATRPDIFGDADDSLFWLIGITVRDIGPDLKLTDPRSQALAADLTHMLLDAPAIPPEAFLTSRWLAVASPDEPKYYRWHGTPVTPVIEYLIESSDRIHMDRTYRRHLQFAPQVKSAPNLAAARDAILTSLTTNPRMARDVDDSMHGRLLLRLGRLAAAVSLAQRRFELDHHRPPANLSELVPAYLPHLPVDPFDPAGGPLLLVHSTKPSGAPRSLIVSVYRDGKSQYSNGTCPIPADPRDYPWGTEPDGFIDLYRWDTRVLPPNTTRATPLPNPTDHWLDTK
jgi:hypothetical protein